MNEGRCSISASAAACVAAVVVRARSVDSKMEEGEKMRGTEGGGDIWILRSWATTSEFGRKALKSPAESEIPIFRLGK